MKTCLSLERIQGYLKEVEVAAAFWGQLYETRLFNLLACRPGFRQVRAAESIDPSSHARDYKVSLSCSVRVDEAWEYGLSTPPDWPSVSFSSPSMLLNYTRPSHWLMISSKYFLFRRLDSLLERAVLTCLPNHICQIDLMQFQTSNDY